MKEMKFPFRPHQDSGLCPIKTSWEQEKEANRRVVDGPSKMDTLVPNLLWVSVHFFMHGAVSSSQHTCKEKKYCGTGTGTIFALFKPTSDVTCYLKVRKH
jgi:hypothetical protein